MKKVTRAKSSARRLYIKNPAAHRLAQEVSARLGISLSDAVVSALEDKVRRSPKPVDLAAVSAILDRIALLPIRDRRTDDEILGYDEFGIPR
jgi:antitoxin VapB